MGVTTLEIRDQDLSNAGSKEQVDEKEIIYTALQGLDQDANEALLQYLHLEQQKWTKAWIWEVLVSDEARKRDAGRGIEGGMGAGDRAASKKYQQRQGGGGKKKELDKCLVPGCNWKHSWKECWSRPDGWKPQGYPGEAPPITRPEWVERRMKNGAWNKKGIKEKVAAAAANEDRKGKEDSLDDVFSFLSLEKETALAGRVLADPNQLILDSGATCGMVPRLDLFTTYHALPPKMPLAAPIGGTWSREKGSKYFITFLDDFSRLSWVTLVKTKDEVAKVFKRWIRYAEREAGAKPQGQQQQQEKPQQPPQQHTLLVPVDRWQQLLQQQLSKSPRSPMKRVTWREKLQSLEQGEASPLPRTTCTSRPPERFTPSAQYACMHDHEVHDVEECMLVDADGVADGLDFCLMGQVHEPKSVKEALSRPEWVESMREELESHKVNESFELVDPACVPLGMKYSGGKRSNKGGKRCGGKCWYCHVEGHPWFKCRKLPDGWRPGQPSIEGSKGVHGAMGEGMGSEEGDGGAGGHGGMFYHVGEACSEDMVVPASKVALHCSSHWVIDTGAFMTMTNREDLQDEVRPSKAATVVSATGQVVPVRGEERAMFMGADGRLVGLKCVLLVPGLCANLLSTKALSEAGMKMEMMGTKVFKATLDGCVLWDLRGGKDMHRSMWEIPVMPWMEAAARLAAEAVRGGHASHVTSGGGEDGSDGGLLVHGGVALPSVTPSTGETDWLTAHRRFGHMALPQLQQLFITPPMYITLYYLVTRLPDSLSSIMDHFLSLCPTELTVDLLEERLAAAEKSILAVGASRGDRRTLSLRGVHLSPFSPLLLLLLLSTSLTLRRSELRLPLVGGTATARARGERVVEETAGAATEAVEEAEGVTLEVGVVPGVGASVAVVEVVEAAAEVVEAAAEVVEAAAAVVEVAAAVVLVGWYVGSGRSGGAGPCTYVLRTGSRRGEMCRLPHTSQRCFGRLSDAWRAQFPDAIELPRWHDLLRQNVAIFDLDFEAILAAMYAVTDSAEGAEPGRAEPERVGSGGAEPAGAGTGGVESGGAELEGVEPGGAEPGCTTSWGAEPACAESGGSPGVPLRREPLSPQRLREWYTQRRRRATGAAGAGAAGGATAAGGAAGAGAGGGATGAGAARGAAGAGAAGGAAGAGAAGGAAGAGAAGPGGAHTGGTGAAGAGGAAGVCAAGTGGGGAAGVEAGDPEGTGAVSAVPGVAVRPRPYYVPLLQKVLGLQPSPGPTPPLLSPPPVQSHLSRNPQSRSESPICAVRAGRCVTRPRPPPVPGTHSMTLCPSTAPQRVPLPSPPASSLPDGPEPESKSLCAASPTITRFLVTAVTDPLFESTAASVLVAELVDFAAACRLDYATSLVACFAATVPHLVSMLLAPEGDPDAPDIPTPRSYAEAIEGPYSSQWQAAMDAKMASWKSTGTYVNEVPPPGANIVSGMWIFRVKRPPGSPPVFKARYVARGFSQRQGVDFFQTFSSTPKMTTLRVLLHVATQCDYKLHSLDFSTAFLQGSLHEEIWLRRPRGFTGSFPAGTQWSLRRPVYGLRQAPREWHDTLRTTLAALGFAPSTADPSLFLRTDTTLSPFYVLVYVDDLVFATADTEALTHVKSELQKRHTCTDLGPSALRLNVLLAQSTPLPTDHSLSAPPSEESVEPSGPYPELVGCHITLGMGLVLGGRARVVLTGHADASWVDDLATQRSSQGYTFSLGSGSVSWRSTRSSSVLSSSCEAEIYAGAMAAQELRWLTYLLTDLGEAPRSPPVLYFDNKAMLALCQEHRLEHRTKHISLRFFLALDLQQRGQLRLAYVASQANTADVFTKALQPCDHQPCFAFLDWSFDLLFSTTLPMGVCYLYPSAS
ncbi:unnamed protein product [Closterium sp. NIES-53]